MTFACALIVLICLRREPHGTLGIRRTDYTEGTEFSPGGNGVFGHMETSEDFNQTFEELNAVTQPNPGAP